MDEFYEQEHQAWLDERNAVISFHEIPQSEYFRNDWGRFRVDLQLAMVRGTLGIAVWSKRSSKVAVQLLCLDGAGYFSGYIPTVTLVQNIGQRNNVAVLDTSIGSIKMVVDRYKANS